MGLHFVMFLFIRIYQRRLSGYGSGSAELFMNLVFTIIIKQLLCNVFSHNDMIIRGASPHVQCKHYFDKT